MPKGWVHCLYLQTTERLYILCAKSLEDRNMWMSGFRYIIASTITVQTIMKNNNQIMDDKLKARTKTFQHHEVVKKKGVSQQLSKHEKAALKLLSQKPEMLPVQNVNRQRPLSQMIQVNLKNENVQNQEVKQPKRPKTTQKLKNNYTVKK